jgi:uncharacterized protein YkwD
MSESGANGRYKPRRKATRAASRSSRSNAANTRPTPTEITPPSPEPPRYAPRTSDESSFWATAQSAGASNESSSWANTEARPASTPQYAPRPDTQSALGSASYIADSHSRLGVSTQLTSRTGGRSAAGGSPSWVTQSAAGATSEPTARTSMGSGGATSLGSGAATGAKAASDTTTTRGAGPSSTRTADTTTGRRAATTAAAASGSGGRGGSRAATRAASGGRSSRARRPLIAIASVVLVITPISWILLHQPQNDDADASVPIVTRTDDTYVTPTTKPAASTPPVPRPTTPKATPTPTPTDSATPTSTPSTSEPTRVPTTGPTEQGTTAPTATPSTRRPTATPSTTSTPTAPPPPADDGNMKTNELALFNLIDEARQSNGCAPLQRDSDVTAGARGDADNRAESGSVNASGSSMSAAGGDNWTAQKAFNQMMSQSRSTILNCGLKTLGVGFGTAPHCTVEVLWCLSSADRNAWVADFT